MADTRFDDAQKNWAGKITVGEGGKVTVARTTQSDMKTPRLRTQAQRGSDLRPEAKNWKGKRGD